MVLFTHNLFNKQLVINLNQHKKCMLIIAKNDYIYPVSIKNILLTQGSL